MAGFSLIENNRNKENAPMGIKGVVSPIQNLRDLSPIGPVGVERPQRIITPSNLWGRFLEASEGRMSSYVLDTWLKPLQCVAFDGQTVTLEVCDEFSRDWLKEHYEGFICDGLKTQTQQPVSLAWVINPKLREDELAPTPAPTPVPTPTPTITPRSFTDDAPNYARSLNKRYKFENFVCGPSNEFAMAGCRAVAERPGSVYNPLFLYGRVGLGKTHLLSAVGHAIKSNKPDAKIIYMSAEDFTNEVVNAVLGNKLDAFRRRYRHQCDVLMIDDIQLIAGRERTQHEFFHIFNALYDSERQIVVASDKLPHEIPDIEERLRNRFQFGLIADIQTPEIETRVAILRRKATNENIELSDDVAFFLAEHVHSNVRELEGALVRVLAHASLTQAPITTSYVKHVLGSIIVGGPKTLSVEHIQQTVAEYFTIDLSALRGRRRLKNLVRPRQIAMYLSRRHTEASYPELGRKFEKKDHTTVLSAFNKIKTLLKNELQLQRDVRAIEQRLGVASR